jgi:regulator of cell morphogenesis and NO signaling
MSLIDPDASIGQVVAERPESARLFQRLGLDYCCGGDRSLKTACAEEGLDATTVIRMMEAEVMLGEQEAVEEKTRDWATAPLGDLIEHIVDTHHDYLRRKLPQIGELLEKVSHVHGTTAPWISSVKEVFDDLRPSMEAHIEKEEQIVFPFIRECENGGPRSEPDALGGDPIGLMEEEHDETGAALKRIRTLSRDFTPPQGACDSFHKVIDWLEQLEADTHQHVHKENSILFPRARDLL